MKKIVLEIIILFNCSLLNAAQIKDIYFKDKINVENKELYIVGTGFLKYLKVFTGYVGAFYLESNKNNVDALDNVAKRLELSYFYKIEAKDFAEATTEMIKKNVKKEEYKQLEKKIMKFNALYQDVKPNDRYAITYIPGKGTILTLNNKIFGIIKGYNFSVAVFSIWLGENPIDIKMKTSLLGK